MTTSLLALGIVSAVGFVVVLAIEGARRLGYDPAYHTGSELQLGPRGWVQIANFLQMGAGSAAFALGIYRVLDSSAAAGLLTLFAFGMVTAGVMVPDPGRGYPPGPSTRTDAPASWRHRLHHVLGGPVAFLAIFGACVVVAREVDHLWMRVYSLVTAAAGLALTGWTAAAYSKDAGGFHSTSQHRWTFGG